MTYTLSVQDINNLSQELSDHKKLTGILSSTGYEIILIKHNQNFYQQHLSHFIVIQSKTNFNEKNKFLKIRKTLFSNTIEKNNESDIEKQKPHQNPQMTKVTQIECTINDSQSFDLNRIVSGNFIHENALLVLSDPFELLFITKKSVVPIKIILQQIYDMSNIVGSFSFESNEQDKKRQPFILTIYGFDQSTQTNKMLTINLTTFDVKQIAQSKDYSPKPRKNPFKMFHDDRLYVFGGQILGKKQQQQLLWSFDIQKGYWFALQMKYSTETQIYYKYLSTVYDSGKMIILRQGAFYLLEIYQCKIWQLDLEQGNQLKNLLQNNQIIGLLTYQKKVYFYTKNSFLQKCLSLHKVSKQSEKNIQSKKQI